MLLDSNIIIGAAKQGGEGLALYLQDPRASVSIVTRIESLGFHKLTFSERTQIVLSLGLLPELPLDGEIADQAIAYRQTRKMKLGDAIIAATAVQYNVPLVTRNVADFRGLDGLDVIDANQP